MINNPEVIITGATGFVGRNLIPQIVKYFPKNKILCLIRNQNTEFEFEGRKIFKKYGISTKYVDLVMGEGLSNLPKKPKLIIHLAAETDTSKKDHRVNNVGVKNLYNAFTKLGPETHFIYIGTMVSVVGRKNCKIAINEDTKSSPTNEYTRTKADGENFLINKCKKDKFRLTILTPNTIYGKGFRKGSLFYMVINMIKNNSFITRINWLGKSALIHVNDVIENIIYFSSRYPKPGVPEKYLLYSENLSISNISKLIHKQLNIKYKPINLPKCFWGILSSFRVYFPILESIFPPQLYNYVWRLSIIIDDVVYTDSQKAFKKNKNWKPKKLETTIKEIIS